LSVIQTGFKTWIDLGVSVMVCICLVLNVTSTLSSCCFLVWLRYCKLWHCILVKLCFYITCWHIIDVFPWS